MGACSAYQGWNEIGLDEFHIQRIHGDPNFSRFKNWMTYDPRFARVKRFDYSGGEFDKSKLESPPAKPMPGVPLGEINLMPNTYQHPSVQ